MVTLEQAAGLALACAVLIAVPGPAVLFIVGRALSYGRPAALAGVAGNAAGVYLAAVAVAVGLGPLLERSALLFEVIKWAGAAYLIWLGIQAMRDARHPAAGTTVVAEPVRLWRGVRTGILVGAGNPKSFIVFAAILPQFVDRAGGAVPLQMLLLGLVPVIVGLIFDSVWALAAGQARQWLVRSPRRLRAVGRAGALCTIGLGVSVAFTGRQ
ncbi:lysine transporter LysE [Actinoplanes sp. OR16]|uniref:LysE family translocator n=1 Tax=Actinoplanes sp. OR16 TaxID=946334 RepID=UPI000F701A4E|nr:LysE family translocator [Actinoplanes sp. OR16]BBH69879.1 lysine transporter LysE [Actinoplanes sp. OR16]